MAHTFLKAQKIVDTTLALVEQEMVLARTLWNVSSMDWSGALNDTITLRIPATLTAREYEWRTRNNPIVFDDLTETSYDIKIGGHVYSAVKVTDEQLTLDIVSFADQILAPQAKAVAVKLESNAVGVFTNLPVKNVVQLDKSGNGVEGDVTASNGVTTAIRNTPQAAVIAARKFLNKAGVPFEGRFLVIGADMEEEFLTSDQLVRYDQSNSTSALRDATIGRIGGFEVVVSNQIAADRGYAYHRSAVAMYQAAPAIPAGVAYGAAQSRNGYAMRWIRDYDPNFLQDRSVVSAFYGLQGINDGPLIDTGDVDTDLDDASNIRAVRLELVA